MQCMHGCMWFSTVMYVYVHTGEVSLTPLLCMKSDFDLYSHANNAAVLAKVCFSVV